MAQNKSHFARQQPALLRAITRAALGSWGTCCPSPSPGYGTAGPEPTLLCSYGSPWGAIPPQLLLGIASNWGGVQQGQPEIFGFLKMAGRRGRLSEEWEG